MNGKLADRLEAFLERAYAPSASLRSWLNQLTGELERLVPGSLGTVGRLVRTREDAAPALLCPYAVHVDRGAVERTLETHQHHSEHRLDLVEGGPGLRSFRHTALGREDRYVRAMVDRFERVGVRNLHHLTASDGAGHTVSLGLLSRSAERVGVPRLLWAVVEGHLETSLRIQVRVHHPRALPTARSLRGAVDALRTPTAPRTPLGARHADAVWRGIVDGTWMVLDQRDVAGRRYVVAVPGDPDHLDRRALTYREARIAGLVAAGHSDKEIAYAFDLARSTIAGHLREALRKLRLPSRVHLASAFRPSPDEASVVPGALDAFALAGGATLLTFDLPAAREGRALPRPLLARLSPAEARVAVLALQGLTDVEIAAATGRARHTVSNQLRAAYRRLGVRSRAELAVIARVLT